MPPGCRLPARKKATCTHRAHGHRPPLQAESLIGPAQAISCLAAVLGGQGEDLSEGASRDPLASTPTTGLCVPPTPSSTALSLGSMGGLLGRSCVLGGAKWPVFPVSMASSFRHFRWTHRGLGEVHTRGSV